MVPTHPAIAVHWEALYDYHCSLQPLLVKGGGVLATYAGAGVASAKIILSKCSKNRAFGRPWLGVLEHTNSTGIPKAPSKIATFVETGLHEIECYLRGKYLLERASGENPGARP